MARIAYDAHMSGANKPTSQQAAPAASAPVLPQPTADPITAHAAVTTTPLDPPPSHLALATAHPHAYIIQQLGSTAGTTPVSSVSSSSSVVLAVSDSLLCDLAGTLLLLGEDGPALSTLMGLPQVLASLMQLVLVMLREKDWQGQGQGQGQADDEAVCREMFQQPVVQPGGLQLPQQVASLVVCDCQYDGVE